MARVTVREGELEGELVQNPYGGSYYSFKGIPYGDPSLGELRFKAPQPKTPWEGVRSAKEHGQHCYQYDFLFTLITSGDEDCLYLNVYSPDLSPSQPMPVMFSIYGGAFTFGNGNSDFYGPEYLMRHGVILVTLNYRTEALGFLSLDSKDIPGNDGMKDQVAALRWVNKNIQHFGGNPHNITIIGESSAACCVAYHLVSPMTKGLFRRAIVSSGSALSTWGQAFEARERARAYARQMGLDSNDDKELYEFFKSLPREKLVDLNAILTFSEQAKVSRGRHFGIVSETQFPNTEGFFYGDVYDAFRNGIHDGVEVITGYCEHEGYLAFLGLEINKIIDQANNFLQVFTPTDISMNCSERDQLQVGRIFKEYYYKNKKVSMEEIDPFIRYFSIETILHKTMQTMRWCAKRNKTYLYKFTCKSELNVFGGLMKLQPIIGDKKIVNHGDDLLYLYRNKFVSVDADSEAFKYIETLVKLWTNFMKYGDPTPDDSLGARWSPYTQQEQHYLEIGHQLVAGTAPDSQEIAFWDGVYRQYLPSHLAE